MSLTEKKRVVVLVHEILALYCLYKYVPSLKKKNAQVAWANTIKKIMIPVCTCKKLQIFHTLRQNKKTQSTMMQCNL